MVWRKRGNVTDLCTKRIGRKDCDKVDCRIMRFRGINDRDCSLFRVFLLCSVVHFLPWWLGWFRALQYWLASMLIPDVARGHQLNNVEVMSTGSGNCVVQAFYLTANKSSLLSVSLSMLSQVFEQSRILWAFKMLLKSPTLLNEPFRFFMKTILLVTLSKTRLSVTFCS